MTMKDSPLSIPIFLLRTRQLTPATVLHRTMRVRDNKWHWTPHSSLTRQGGGFTLAG